MTDAIFAVIADIAIVRPSPYQPRKHVNQEQRDALRESIARNGLIHPPVARRLEDKTYELVAGHQRYEAMCELINFGDERFPYKGIPLDVRTISDEQAAAMALDENTQREDLRTMEQVLAWQRMIDQGGLTQQRVADLVGLDRATVANYLRLTVLPTYVLELVDAGRIKPRAARELLAFYNGHELRQAEIYLTLLHCDKEYSRGDLTPEKWASKILSRERILEDFSTKEIRSNIHDVITRPGSGWRPIEQPAKNKSHLYGKTANLPMFDVKKFKEDFPESLFSMPQSDSESSALWTTRESEWGKRQSAAKQAAKRAAENADGAAKPAPQQQRSAAPWRAKYEKMLQNDPVIQAAAKSVPMGTFDPKKPNPEVLKAAGTRGRSPTPSRGLYGIGPKQHNDDRPMYFDEPKECNTCTKGARFVFDYMGDVSMSCDNRQCFEEKAAKGRKTFEETFAKICDKRDQADMKRAEKLRIELKTLPHFATVAIAEALLRTTDTRFEQAGDYYKQLTWRDENIGKREQATMAKVREILGISGSTRPHTHSFVVNDETLQQLRAKPELAANVAALLTARTASAQEDQG